MMKGRTCGMFAALSCGNKGALFFFANTLWGKFNAKEVMFDCNVFWGGLRLLRLAEAIVLTIALFYTYASKVMKKRSVSKTH
jgi:hypothetical protein